MEEEVNHEVTLQAECYESTRKHRFNIQYYIYEADGMYIAYCPALDITSTGEDINDVVTQFYEHFQLYIECCIEDNTLIQDLQNHGWKLEGVKIYQPSFGDMMMKQEFRRLMESDTEYERRNAILQFEER
ncbi:MAG: hypothetical protein NC095_06215 [Muribaculum sp.]|nr:hypothetical protein [Muribaculum sp.]